MTTQGFFGVSVLTLNEIVVHGGDARDLATYLVLANHTNGRGDRQHMDSTAGAKAVKAKAGLTYRVAGTSLAWLEDHGFISPYQGGKGSKAGYKGEVRWSLVKPNSSDVAYLSHSLIDGIGAGKNNPPLKRIREQVHKGCCKNVKEASTDALLLLIHCYQEHLLQDFGGINIHVLRKEWAEVESREFMEDLGYLVMEISGGNPVASQPWIEKVLAHVPDGELDDRFRAALKSLEKLGLLYEVLEVWEDNPLENDRAELFYPLYVCDYHARESEPYCLKDTHRFLERNGHWDGMIMMQTIDEVIGTNQFRLIRLKSDKQCVIGTYRLRFKPNTEDVAK